MMAMVMVLMRTRRLPACCDDDHNDFVLGQLGHLPPSTLAHDDKSTFQGLSKFQLKLVGLSNPIEAHFC